MVSSRTRIASHKDNTHNTCRRRILTILDTLHAALSHVVSRYHPRQRPTSPPTTRSSANRRLGGHLYLPFVTTHPPTPQSYPPYLHTLVTFPAVRWSTSMVR